MIKNANEIRDAITGELIAGKIVGYNHYEVDGVKISIEVREDALSKRILEFYPNFAEEPQYTPDGRPFTLAVEDACPDAEHADDGLCIDCTGCKFYRKAAEKTLFGVCMNDKKIKNNT